jgi:serine kinase of HPr protein (carbohydrate metabolism regulator)
VRVCLGVSAGHSESPAAPCVIRAREHLMSIVSDAENFMQCDFDRGFGFGWVTQSTAADHPWLRYHFLMAGGSGLAQQRAFAPLHGALVMRQGTGVMFCGDSCAGKSTLAYACARAGWTYLSDDGTFLVRDREDRYAVGEPCSIRFRADAPELFPELADRLPTVRPNGKIAIEVRTRDLGISTARACVVDHVVFLEREKRGPASVDHYPQDRALEYWSQYALLGSRDVRADQRRCHALLLRARLWKMKYSQLDDAVSQLERLVG